MSKELQPIALALGIKAESDATAIHGEIQSLKLAKAAAETKVTELKGVIAENQKAEAIALVDKGIALGLIPEQLKESQLAAFKNDHDGQKVILSKLISDKEAEQQHNGQQAAVKAVVLGGGKTPTGTADDKECYDYLQRFDPVELKRIHTEEPERYVKLAKEFGEGKRYAGK